MNRMTVEEMIEGASRSIFGDIPNSDKTLKPYPRREQPTCNQCGADAEIVCLRGRWVYAGCPAPAEPDNLPGIFCCREHTEPTAGYWFWLVAPEKRDGTAPTIQEFWFLLHVARKNWGMPFLTWLFKQCDLNYLAPR